MLNIGQINYCDVANGEGIRVSVFVSGCNFHCKGCFNKEAQDFNYGKPYNEDMRNLILEHLKDDKYDGISLLGGDPMCQDNDGLKELVELCKSVHQIGKTVWCWTGYTKEEIDNTIDEFSMIRKELLKEVDVLIDGRFEESLRDITLVWKGSSNQRIINLNEGRA